MEAQFQQMKKERESGGTDEPDVLAGDLPATEQAPPSGAVFPVYNRSDTQQISPEEQKNRLAKAEAMYGAIAEAVEASENPDETVSCRA